MAVTFRRRHTTYCARVGIHCYGYLSCLKSVEEGWISSMHSMSHGLTQAAISERSDDRMTSSMASSYTHLNGLTTRLQASPLPAMTADGDGARAGVIQDGIGDAATRL